MFPNAPEGAVRRDSTDVDRMRVITLHQPWATLIALGLKLCETRDWPVPPHIVGRRVAVHAGRRAPCESEWNEQVRSAVAGVDHPLGVIVATARIEASSQVVSRGYYPVIGEEADPGRVWVLDAGGGERSDVYQVPTDGYGDFSELR